MEDSIQGENIIVLDELFLYERHPGTVMRIIIEGTIERGIDLVYKSFVYAVRHIMVYNKCQRTIRNRRSAYVCHYLRAVAFELGLDAFIYYIFLFLTTHPWNGGLFYL